jgi:hypothetical protein
VVFDFQEIEGMVQVERVTDGLTTKYFYTDYRGERRQMCPEVAVHLLRKADGPPDDNPILRLCHHESAHVITALDYGVPVYSVEIDPINYRGTTSHAPPAECRETEDIADDARARGGMSLDALLPNLVGLLSAGIAEHRFNGRVSFIEQDLRDARNFLDATSLSEEQRRIVVQQCMGHAQKIVERWWHPLSMLAMHLRRCYKMNRDEILSFLRGVSGGRQLLGEHIADLVRERLAREAARIPICDDHSHEIGWVEETGGQFIGRPNDARIPPVVARTLSAAAAALRDAVLGTTSVWSRAA